MLTCVFKIFEVNSLCSQSRKKNSRKKGEKPRLATQLNSAAISQLEIIEQQFDVPFIKASKSVRPLCFRVGRGKTVGKARKSGKTGKSEGVFMGAGQLQRSVPINVGN